MADSSATDCVLREVAFRSYWAEHTVTVQCKVRPDSGPGQAEGYGTATTEAVARKKALSEAVERLLACTPFALIARRPTPRTDRSRGTDPWQQGLRSAPADCLVRNYRSLSGEQPRQVPLFWSSPWVAGREMRSANLAPQAARLSSTVGWAVAPSPEAALHGALFELTELLNYGAFLYRCLAAPRERPAPGEGSEPHEEGRTLTVPISWATRTPTILAVTRSSDRLMPATGIGSGTTASEAAERAFLELAQAETLWRANSTAVPAERYFMRRFEKWPLLRRCAALDFDLGEHAGPLDDGTHPSPLGALESRSVEVWADPGAVDISGADLRRTRLCFAHVVSDPQPLLGLVRAGIPVFDTGEVRKVLVCPRRARPADRSPSGRVAHSGRPTRA